MGEDVDPKPGATRKAIGNIAGTLLLQLVNRVRIPANQIGGDSGGVFCAEDADAWYFELNELTVGFGLRGPSGRENEVTRVLNPANHGSNDR